MAIYDLLPKFGYIEPNNLKGLQPGFVVAQMPVATAAKATLTVKADGSANGDFMENGTICAISKDGIVAPDADSKALFICFSEPLHTVVVADPLYAVNLKEEHPRLVQLIPGDEWMATKALTLSGALAGRIVEIDASSELKSSDDFYACTTMANGDAGHHYMFIG